MNLLEKIKQFPTEPGIYLFYNKNKELIYIGKATSLRNRVQSYFRGPRSSRPIEQMMHEVMDIKIKQTDSVLEAVILEANYIKKYLPKYNVDGKDDKSWNYVVVSDDLFPRVYTVRQHELSNQQSQQIQQTQQYKYIFGPYPGLKTREMMKLLNRLFFISTCKPSSAKATEGKPIYAKTTTNKRHIQNKQSRPCLYRQIGQCLGVCTGEISSREYKSKVILPLVTFLRGGKKKLVKSLEIKMNREAKQENFEEAGRLRNQIGTLSRIHDIALLNDSFFNDVKTSPAGTASSQSTSPNRRGVDVAKNKGFLTIIDESHVTLPQIRGMYAGDRARKENLVEHGFRLPSALDNRPLMFDEFSQRIQKTIFVSATPSVFEIEQSGQVVEQIVRPTGLIDPEIVICPVTGGKVLPLVGGVRGGLQANKNVVSYDEPHPTSPS